MLKRNTHIPTLALCCVVVLPAAPPASTHLLRNSSGASDTWASVGQFRGPRTCTATLVDPSGSNAPDARAWAITAGHCISLDAFAVIRDQPLSAEITFNFFIDTPDDRIPVRTRTTGWSTMKGVDLALVELDATLGELRTRGLRPLRIAATPTGAGKPVYYTGIPLTPIPASQQFIRRGDCRLGERARVLESSWIWHDELTNDCPDLYGGASGSPLFDATSGDIVGIIGSGTFLNFEEGPDFDCQTNRPCVITPLGTVMQKDTGYASPVPNIAPCFDPMNALDVHRQDCPLDPGRQLTVTSTPNEVQPVNADGKPATWDAALSGAQRYYAWKQFPAGLGDCTIPAGYSTPVATASAPVIRDLVGTADGYYFLCVLAGDTPSMDATWQRPAYASTRFKRLDSQPPVLPIKYSVEQVPDGFYLHNLTGGTGTSGLGPMFYKLGPASSTDCSDPEGYRVQISIPTFIRASLFPLRMCWRISDRAGNARPILTFELGPPTLFPHGVQNGANFAREAIAAGSVFRVDTFSLTAAPATSSVPVPTLAGVQASVRDAAGRTLPVNLTMAGPLFLEALMPESAAPGEATLIVQPPQGPALTQPFRIRRVAPGLYVDVSDAPVGFVTFGDTALPLSVCNNTGRCTTTPLPAASTPGGIDLVLYGTGFHNAAGTVRVRIGTHIIENATVARHPDIAGVDELRIHVPQDFPLHLYQAISLEAEDAVSNHAWIYFE